MRKYKLFNMIRYQYIYEHELIYIVYMQIIQLIDIKRYKQL
jgi:hypothetical protein